MSNTPWSHAGSIQASYDDVHKYFNKYICQYLFDKIIYINFIFFAFSFLFSFSVYFAIYFLFPHVFYPTSSLFSLPLLFLHLLTTSLFPFLLFSFIFAWHILVEGLVSKHDPL